MPTLVERAKDGKSKGFIGTIIFGLFALGTGAYLLLNRDDSATNRVVGNTPTPGYVEPTASSLDSQLLSPTATSTAVYSSPTAAPETCATMAGTVYNTFANVLRVPTNLWNGTYVIVDNPNNLGGDPNIDDLTAEKPHKFVTIYAADTMRQLPHLGANICVPTGAIVK